MHIHATLMKDVEKAALVHCLDTSQQPIADEPLAFIVDERARGEKIRMHLLSILVMEGDFVDVFPGKPGVSERLRELPYEENYAALWGR